MSAASPTQSRRRRPQRARKAHSGALIAEQRLLSCVLEGMALDDLDEPGWTTSFYLYESPTAKRAVDLSAIEGDLEEALRALDDIEAVDNSPDRILVNRALWNYALTLYARVFTKGRRPVLTVQLQNVLTDWPAGRDVHEHILGVRNKHVAHVTSDMEKWGTAIELGTHLDGRIRMKAMGMVVSVTGPLTDPIAVDFGKLVSLLLGKVRETMQVEWEAVNEEIRGKGMTPADIEQLPVAPPVGGAHTDSWKRSRR